MDLDKYRRTPSSPLDDNSSKPVASQPPEAPSLDSAGDSRRQKATRYRSFVHQESELPKPVKAVKSAVETVPDPPGEAAIALTTQRHHEATKGNTFKSGAAPTTSRKQSVRLCAQSKKRKPSSHTGVKLVYVAETMRQEYMQIAGYLMLKYRVKLTMTAYFCFLHDQAVIRQGDESFLATLAQFVKRDTTTSTP